MQSQHNSTRVQAPEISYQVEDASSNPTEHHDRTSSTPKGRDALDGRNEKVALLKCRKNIKISTMNVRTIRTKSKQHELSTHATIQGIEVIGIVDHKICHEEEDLEYHQLDNHTLITSSAWRNSGNSPVGVVGIMVNRKIESAFISVK